MSLHSVSSSGWNFQKSQGFCLVCFGLVYETESVCVPLAVLELTPTVDQTGLKLGDLPVSASRVLGNKDRFVFFVFDMSHFAATAGLELGGFFKPPFLPNFIHSPLQEEYGL